MTTVFPSTREVNATAPGTHVLIIGVGGYPHLQGGDPEKRLDNTMGLKQLSPPAVSAQALAEWFVGRQADADGCLGFCNPTAPLASIEMLVSPPWQPKDKAQPHRCALDSDSAIPVDGATRDQISACYATWLGRVNGNPDNIGVFYFCGHGITGRNDYVLPEDFGHTPLNAWPDAIDIVTTARAARRTVPGALYFFVDACRQNKREPSYEGAQPPSLEPVRFEKPVQCFSRLMLWATGEGQEAHGATGKPSRFVSALIQALSGLYGEPAPEGGRWIVTGDALAKLTEQIIRDENDELDMHLHQHTEVQRIGSQPFHYLSERPRKVGQILSLVQVSRNVRELVDEATGAGELPSMVKESIAEGVESGKISAEKIQQEVARWLQNLMEWLERLVAEPDRRFAQRLRELLTAGKQDEAHSYYT